MPWSIDGCRARLDRVDAHLQAIHRENGAYVARNPYELVAEFDAETGWHRLYLDVTKPPGPIFGMLIGEAAHHLRAALDNLAWQLANLDGSPPEPDKVQFPIFSKPLNPPEKFYASVYMNGMRREHMAVLEGIQPYGRSEVEKARGLSYLELLARINNTDKHKVLHTTASLAQDVAPESLQTHPGYRLAGAEFVPAERLVLKDRTYIGKVLVRPSNPELQMDVQGYLDLGVAFGDPDTPLYGLPADGTLKVLKEGVEQIIGIFDRPGMSGSPPWP